MSGDRGTRRVRHRDRYPQKSSRGDWLTELLLERWPHFGEAGFGRPDWLYYGGMTRLLWWGSVLGEWVTDLGAWKMFGLRELEAVVETEPAAISGGRKAK